jgi:hypothetical protein
MTAPDIAKIAAADRLPPLQDALRQIFDDAGGSDMLVDLLVAFNFESKQELAEAIVYGLALRAHLQEQKS